MFIKRADGNFIQWGSTGDECHPEHNTEGWAFGPDVQSVDSLSTRPVKPIGIFGLSHRELLRSEWVADDALTARFELEVRGHSSWSASYTSETKIEVPPAALCKNFLALLDDGRWSDVTFVVDSEKIMAHSQILSARSEIFDRQLHGSMRESATKEIVVEDCDFATFKAFLQFLYSDEFTSIEEVIKTASAADGVCNTGSSACSPQRALLQNLLAISHKYEVPRLRQWCEQKLCVCITVEDVCSILCQAHLYGAKTLEEVCLTFVKAHMEQVAATAMFGTLAKDWPEVILKISLFTAGVPVSKAMASSIAAPPLPEEPPQKRKRDE